MGKEELYKLLDKKIRLAAKAEGLEVRTELTDKLGIMYCSFMKRYLTGYLFYTRAIYFYQLYPETDLDKYCEKFVKDCHKELERRG